MTQRFSALLLGIALVSFAALAQGQVAYTVKPGDTLYRIALEHGVSAAELAALNALSDPNSLAVGQRLELPGTPPLELHAPFRALSLEPQSPRQGQSVALKVALERPGSVTGPISARFLDWDYELSPTPEGAEGILAVNVLQEPGVYELVLDAEGVTLTVPVRVLEADYPRESITLPPAASDLLQRDLIREELAFVRSSCRPVGGERRWQGAFRWPLDEPVVTSGFGTRRSYNGGPYNSYHEGIDLRGDSSTPVYAAAAGRVIIAEALMVRGNAVYLHHGMSVCSGYTHLDRLEVSPGQEVAGGELLGWVGMTGLATGPHLHWEIRVRETPVDPAPWLSAPPLVD